MDPHVAYGSMMAIFEREVTTLMSTVDLLGVTELFPLFTGGGHRGSYQP